MTGDIDWHGIPPFEPRGAARDLRHVDPSADGGSSQTGTQCAKQTAPTAESIAGSPGPVTAPRTLSSPLASGLS